MTIAERTREAVRTEPFLHEALRAGVLNYTAAARYLDVGDVDAVSAALRRFGDDLEPAADDGTARVRMHSGLGRRREDDSDEPALPGIDGAGFVPDAGSLTAIVATGDICTRHCASVLSVVDAHDIEVTAFGMRAETLVLVVANSAAPETVRLVESVVGRN